MPRQILTLRLDGITAGDYLTWCRDPDPPALDSALRSVSIDADLLGDTVTAILDWNEPAPAAAIAATAAGLPLPAGVEILSATTVPDLVSPERDASRPRASRWRAASQRSVERRLMQLGLRLDDRLLGV